MAERSWASFYLGDGLFGLENFYIREVNRSTGFTTVDLAPPFVRGLLNLRGQIVTVLDLRVRLGLERTTLTNQSRCIVLKSWDEVKETPVGRFLGENQVVDTLGLLVDRMGDIIQTPPEGIEPAPANVGEIDNRFIDGVVKLPECLLVVLRLQEVLGGG